jgi:hypothetical protein
MVMRSIPVLRPSTWWRAAAWLLPVLLCGSLSAPLARAADETLDQALRRQADGVVKYLRSKGYHYVGVLKFRAQKGSDERTDNAGPINLAMADRLEVALLLADPDERLGIIHAASATLRKADNFRANHLTVDGRKSCFDTWFNLPYGNGAPVKADAFVTGLVTLSVDRRTTKVCLLAFDRTGEMVKLGKSFTVATDPRTLIEAGDSFLISKGAFDGGTISTAGSKANSVQLARADAGEVAAEKKTFPLPDASAPVELRVQYDGVEQKYTVRDGQAFVPEPRAGQQVAFGLRNNTKQKVGVVLMINGESTLFREKGDPVQCRKWVLEPGKAYLIPEYQLDAKRGAPFKVQPPEISASNEVNYGPNVGTFTLVVFGGKTASKVPPPARQDAVAGGALPGDLPQDPGPAPGGGGLTTAKPSPRGAEDEAREVELVGKGIATLSTRPGSLAVLKQQLLSRLAKDARDPLKGKGMIEPGQEQHDSPVEVDPFEADPTPLASTTIRYYKPGSP